MQRLAAGVAAADPSACVVIAGDFNVPADDECWLWPGGRAAGWQPCVSTGRVSTTVKNSSWDNVWMRCVPARHMHVPAAMSPVYRYHECLGAGDSDKANAFALSVSDHLPLHAVLRLLAEPEAGVPRPGVVSVDVVSLLSCTEVAEFGVDASCSAVEYVLLRGEHLGNAHPHHDLLSRA